MQGEAERAGVVQPGGEKAQEILSMCVNTESKVVKDNRTSIFSLLPRKDKWQWVRIERQEIPLKYKK